MKDNLHNGLFLKAFSRVENARGGLRSVLPEKLVQKVDWRTLRRCPGSFVDEQLKERHTDLLFSVRMAGDAADAADEDREAFIYVIVEHQSSSDALMPYRMLRYMVRVWDKYLQDNKHDNKRAKRLPAIVPLVVYHGERRWGAPKRFSELVDLEPEQLCHIAAQVPDFEFVLDDLTTVDDSEIMQRPMSPFGRLVLLSLKRARYSAELGRYLRLWSEVIRQVVGAEGGVDALVVISYYIMRVSAIRPEELREVYAEVAGGRAEEAYMTAAEQLTKEVAQRARAEGRAEGEAEGEARGRAEGEARGRVAVVLKLIELKFGPLSEEVTRRVQHASVEELDRFAERVLDATSIDDVIQ